MSNNNILKQWFLKRKKSTAEHTTKMLAKRIKERKDVLSVRTGAARQWGYTPGEKKELSSAKRHIEKLERKLAKEKALHN